MAGLDVVADGSGELFDIVLVGHFEDAHGGLDSDQTLVLANN